MQVEIKRVLLWYQKPAPWIALGLAGCLGLLALPHAQQVYYRWTEVRKMKRAEEALARGDYAEAVLNARGTLATSGKHVEATRMMARAFEAAGSPYALTFRRQLDAIKPGDTENLLGMAAFCLKAGDVSAAHEALGRLPKQERTSARYHDLAAGIAALQNDPASAEVHAAEAVRLEPANEEYQLRLAALRLKSNVPGQRAEALEVLQRLSTKPLVRSRASRTLLNDALARKESDRALELAAALVACPEATFADKLAHLTVLHELREGGAQPAGAARTVPSADFNALLEKLQKAAAARPEDLNQMVVWMNDNHLALLVPDWMATLPAETVAKPPVAIAVADAYVRGSAWAPLREYLEKTSWGQAEFLRHAYLSRALKGLGDDGEAATSWTLAVESAHARTDKLEALARETAKWGWKGQSEALLWKLAASDSCPRWVTDALWDSALQRQDATMLYTISKLILKAEPKNLAARNRFISLALITGQEADSPHLLAEQLYQEHPENVAVASTYGFSLFLRGRAEEAVAVMDKFPREQLHEPALAFYTGLILAAAGRPDEGEELFRIGADEVQLPELVAIRNFLLGAFDAKAAERHGHPADSAQAWQVALQAAQSKPQWLEILGRVALKWGWTEQAGNVARKLADAGLCPDWAVEPLWAACLRSGDPAQLYQAGKLILEAHPKSLTARSNFILVALLAGKEGDAPQRLAEALFREHPAQPEAIAPQACSLYLQHRGEDALALLHTLPAGQLRQPRLALYSSLLLATTGRPDEAAKALPADIDAAWLPEEKTIHRALHFAFDCRAADQSGNSAAANAAWSQALVQAGSRADLLETLGRLAQKWDAPGRAEEALWKLVDDPACPRWVIDTLAASAEKRRDSAQLYRATRALRRVEPQNLTVRNNFIWLALLTGKAADSPTSLARELHEENPHDAEIATTYALALHQQNKTRDAVAVLSELTPEQLRTARPAWYYGIFLSATGEGTKAQEYLRIGSERALLPEEERLLQRVTAAPVVSAIR